MSVHPVRSDRRQRWRHALITVVAVTTVLTVWITGGFERGGLPWRGPEHELGQTIESRFWDVSVESANTHLDTTLQVHIRATNKQRDAQRDLTRDMLVVRMPDGRALTAGMCFVKGPGPGWQPLVETAAHCDVVMQDPAHPDVAPLVPPFDVEVIVAEQEIDHPFLEARGPRVIAEAAGWVPVTVEAG